MLFDFETSSDQRSIFQIEYFKVVNSKSSVPGQALLKNFKRKCSSVSPFEPFGVLNQIRKYFLELINIDFNRF